MKAEETYTKEEFAKQVLWRVGIILTAHVVVHLICSACSKDK